MRPRFLHLFWLLGAAFFAACSGALGPYAGRILLANAAPDTIGYNAMDREVSHRVDPNPYPFPAAALGHRLVAPGQMAAVPTSDVEGFRAGADVRFFVYRIKAGQATLRGVLDAPAAKLARPGYRLLVTADWLAQ